MRRWSRSLLARLRLRTQLLTATLVIICALLGSLLLIVRHTVRSEIDEGVRQSTNDSLRAFENVQQERDLQLSNARSESFVLCRTPSSISERTVCRTIK